MSITVKELAVSDSLYQSRFDINENFAICKDSINDVQSHLDTETQILDGMANVKSSAIQVGTDGDPSLVVSATSAAFDAPVSFGQGHAVTFASPAYDTSYSEISYAGSSVQATLDDLTTGPDSAYIITADTSNGSNVLLAIPDGANGQCVTLIASDSSDFSSGSMMVSSGTGQLILPKGTGGESYSMIEFKAQGQSASLKFVNDAWYLLSSTAGLSDGS